MIATILCYSRIKCTVIARTKTPFYFEVTEPSVRKTDSIVIIKQYVVFPRDWDASFVLEYRLSWSTVIKANY